MKKFLISKNLLLLTLVIGLLLAMFGCGEENKSTSAISTSVGEDITVSGTAVKGPVEGGMVTAYGMNNGAKGEQLGSATTDAQGNFSMTISDYSGPMMLSMNGGTYTDEATGSMMTMGTNDVMTAVMPSISGGASVTGIQITPLTAMAQAMAGDMPGGMTANNIDAANMAMSQYFMVGDVLRTMPMNPNMPGSGAGATQEMRNYGMVMAGMMESAMMLGMPSSSGMVTAMMNDASDGMMNGMMGGNTPVAMGGGMSMMGGGTMMQNNAGTTGLANAMAAFMSSGMNKSGLTVADMQALMDRLNSSSGAIQ
ncbi:MAG: hypothetical protein HZB44_08555 [Actinobacteria bacterium]|nr:hypothetical protein [Actinomycetota bacterium]